MKEENRKYAQEAYEIVEYAANEVGSRLPGSDGEKKYALNIVADKVTFLSSKSRDSQERE